MNLHTVYFIENLTNFKYNCSPRGWTTRILFWKNIQVTILGDNKAPVGQVFKLPRFGDNKTLVGKVFKLPRWGTTRLW